MVNNFISKWTEKEKEPSALSKIKNIAKPQENLKEQITIVTQRLDVQTRTLDAAVQRFEIRDADIFQRVVKAMTERDSARANILATELGEIRKVKENAFPGFACPAKRFHAPKYSFGNGRCNFSVEPCKKPAKQRSFRNVQYISRSKPRTRQHRKPTRRYSHDNKPRFRHACKYDNG